MRAGDILHPRVCRLSQEFQTNCLTASISQNRWFSPFLYGEFYGVSAPFGLKLQKVKIKMIE